jgi:hypothetical protein
MVPDKEFVVESKEQFGGQQEVYCPYCQKKMLYLWKDGHLVGLGIDKWLYCKDCDIKFKLGLYGINQQEFDCKVIDGEKKK